MILKNLFFIFIYCNAFSMPKNWHYTQKTGNRVTYFCQIVPKIVTLCIWNIQHYLRRIETQQTCQGKDHRSRKHEFPKKTKKGMNFFVFSYFRVFGIKVFYTLPGQSIFFRWLWRNYKVSLSNLYRRERNVMPRSSAALFLLPLVNSRAFSR